MDAPVGYYLTKVADRKWAERMLDGELYLQPVSAFGDIVKFSKDVMNTFRGDILEGTAAVTGTSGPGSDFVKEAFESSFPADGRIIWLANDFLRYRIYCLYCFEYSNNTNSFVKPNERLQEFGDTAVMIVNAVEFFRRLRCALSGRAIPLGVCAAQRVNYTMDSSAIRAHNEFSKSPNYSWQNEYRLSIDLEMGRPDKKAWMSMSDLVKIRFLENGGDPDFSSFGIATTRFDIVSWNAKSVLEKIRYMSQFCYGEPELVVRNSLFLQLGNLRDICLSLNTTDMMSLNIPFDNLDHGPYVLPPLGRAPLG
jgi:hypothetical protein